jgi:hypothetical protein
MCRLEPRLARVAPARRYGAGVETPTSTLTGIDDRQSDAALWGRRGFLLALLALVIAALLGVLGVHSVTRQTDDLGWKVSLRYAETARPGLDVPWQVTVTHPGGFGKTLTLAITGSYFDIFETQGFHPNPSEETRDGQTLYLTFTPPPQGDTFVVAYDAYIQPASQVGASGTVGVMDGGQEVAAVPFATDLWP